MDLNLPIIEKLSDCKNILIVGMGGSFDIFCSLPIYFELKRQDYNVHFANFSFSNIFGLENSIHLTETLVGVSTVQEEMAIHYPELYLLPWFQEKHSDNITLWCFQKTGAHALLDNYRILVNHLSIDGILMVDSGYESILRGNEGVTSSLVESTISLFAVNQLTDISTRLLTCTGIGSKHDETSPYILDNVARITNSGGFLGSCALAPQMAVYQDFENAVLYTESKPMHEPTVIRSPMITAVRGEYGDYQLPKTTKGNHLWISPLMNFYWFFDVAMVSKYNLFMNQLQETDTFLEALEIFQTVSPFLSQRKKPINIQ
ncbi:MAG: DUF1152 domain-containing protein [Thiomargarita sp.]|nr:DUF1152 domain-containing protein [Thiomargarita sp.]